MVGRLVADMPSQELWGTSRLQEGRRLEDSTTSPYESVFCRVDRSNLQLEPVGESVGVESKLV